MQNRYVGDIGDYGKYALLRRLTGRRGEPAIRVGVVWCLFPDESHNNDGRHISYLGKAEYAELDRELFDVLGKLVSRGNRSVDALSKSGVLPKDTVFVADPIYPATGSDGTRPANRLRHRSEWLEQCLSQTRNCDLVFLDPDNGLEVVSVSKRHQSAGKYVFWDELLPFWQRGQSLLVYHHLNRIRPAKDQLALLRDRFARSFPDAEILLPLMFRRGSCRVFWLVANQQIGAELATRAADFLASGWDQHFFVEKGA